MVNMQLKKLEFAFRNILDFKYSAKFIEEHVN